MDLYGLFPDDCDGGKIQRSRHSGGLDMALIGNRFAAVLITTALIGTTTSIASARPQDDRHDRDDHRIYDSEHKDYHNWNNDEDKQWHVYIGTEHKKYHDYDKANKREQANYWKWRHEHEGHERDDHPHQ
jgi:hypothetical protein